MRRLLLSLPALLLLGSEALADPILMATPTSIALSPTQTVISFSIDPNGSSVSAFQLSLESLSSGLQIVGIASADPEIATSGPGTSGPNDVAGYLGSFPSADRTATFAVGTVTVEGFTPGTPLVVSGTYLVDRGNSFIPIPASNAATVVPEPATAALIGLGFALLAARRRSRG